MTKILLWPRGIRFFSSVEMSHSYSFTDFRPFSGNFRSLNSHLVFSFHRGWRLSYLQAKVNLTTTSLCDEACSPTQYQWNLDCRISNGPSSHTQEQRMTCHWTFLSCFCTVIQKDQWDSPCCHTCTWITELPIEVVLQRALAFSASCEATTFRRWIAFAVFGFSH
jgi:hypothetical protein